jgi:hypothetical protein
MVNKRKGMIQFVYSIKFLIQNGGRLMFASKRKELFRYLFHKPVNCIFEIIELNGTKLKSNSAYAKLIDVSGHGCRIETRLNLSAKANRIKIALTLKLTNQDIQVLGQLKWQMSSLSYHTYGIQFEDNHEIAPSIMEELKIFAKEITNNQKVG